MAQNPSGKRQKSDGSHSVSHVERILNLLSLLQSGWFTQEELFRHFPNISKRTFYRDLEDIRTVFGRNVRTNAQKKIHFDTSNTFDLQTLDLSYLEVLSLYLICQLGLSQPNRIPYLSPLESVIQKIRLLSRDLIEPVSRLAELQTGLEIGPTVDGTGERWLGKFVEAQEKKVEVFVEYDSIFDDRIIQTTLAPFHLHFNRRAWYVTGRSGYHHAIRTFNIERFLSVELVPERQFFIPIGWNYEQYRGNAWNMIRESEDSDIRLRFSSRVARNVSEIRWHKTQQVISNPDGTIDMYLTVSGFREIVWWILGYGPEVEVLSPPPLRDLVRTYAEKTLAIYQEDLENDGSTPP